MARDISRIIGANSQHNGYFEGNGYRVTWTFGHLCTLKEPADYTEYWKRWSLGQLPMIPERFGIKVISEEYIERQFNVIKSLITEADEVINCGDAGQEGELIQRWVMQKAGIKCPVYRLWISSLTDEAIRDGFANLKPQCDFDSLYHAGLSRAIGDWILGMNATRLYSLKYSSPGNVLSVGRVQTPTLALIVQRQREIENFVPSDYFELKTTYRDTLFNAQIEKFNSLEDAELLADSIKNELFKVENVEKKQARESAPRLFDLTSLQVECNKKWGWSADETLRLIQSLYEKKVTTYPRVDTTYLPEDIYPKIPDILQKMTPYANLTASLLSSKIQKSKKVFDNSKITDHHAIIPTGVAPNMLQGDERQLYHLIALRFIGVFYPDCIFMQTNVFGSAGNIKFKTTGKILTSPGWRSLYPNKAELENEESDNILPEFAVGESGPHIPSVLKKTTQPPKSYTEGTLLRAMEGAGKTVDDEQLREALKENGIGRPSTRSAIIETLFKRRYINRVRKSIIPTAAGCALIDTINDDTLKSAALTGIWESKLRQIERKQFSAAEFIEQLKNMISRIVTNVLSDNSGSKIQLEQSDNKSDSKNKSVKNGQSSSTKKIDKPKSPRIKSLDQIICPYCGQGHMIKGRTAYGCSRYKEGCKILLPFDQYPESLTPAQLNIKIKSLKK